REGVEADSGVGEDLQRVLGFAADELGGVVELQVDTEVVAVAHDVAYWAVGDGGVAVGHAAVDVDVVDPARRQPRPGGGADAVAGHRGQAGAESGAGFAARVADGEPADQVAGVIL